MRILILRNCVVEGSVWMKGDEFSFDNELPEEIVVGQLLLQSGNAREIEEINHRDTESTEFLGVEFMVGKRERNHVS